MELEQELGLDWASVFDHFLPIFSDPEGPCFDGQTLLDFLMLSRAPADERTIELFAKQVAPALRA